MRGKSLYRYIGENGRGYYDEDGTRHQFVRGNCYWLSPSSPILNSSWFAFERIQPPTVTCNSASDLQHDCEQLAAWLDSLPEKMKWRKHTWPLLKESVQNLVRVAVRFGMTEPPNIDGRDEVSVRAALNKLREWAHNTPSLKRTQAKAREGKPASVNQRMAEMLQKGSARTSWTAKRWADCLGVTDAAVKQTDTWKNIQKVRALERWERAERDRR